MIDIEDESGQALSHRTTTAAAAAVVVAAAERLKGSDTNSLHSTRPYTPFEPLVFSFEAFGAV